MTTTSALVVTRHGGPEVLAVEEREVASPGPGQALVEVAAGGVNFIDAYKREGIYPTDPPYVQGFEAAGTVREVGPGTAVSVGDRVAWSLTDGLHAGLVLADADRLVPAMERALESWDTRIPTGRLNAFLGELVAADPNPGAFSHYAGKAMGPAAASAGVATPPAVNIGTGSAPASATSLTSAYGAWSSFAAR